MLWLWRKFVLWYQLRFGIVRERCPKCGSIDVMYNSNMCVDCYYRHLAQFYRE